MELADPDPAWAARYAAEAERIRAALAGMEPAIEHIGSTAVPLRAKPIVDIQVGVDEPARAVAALGALGYAHHGQGGIPGREYLTRREPAFNVHVFARANPVLRDNLRLRDHLRAHPAAAAEYARAKEAALAGGARDLDSYSDAKRAAVTALLEAARRAGGSGPTSC